MGTTPIQGANRFSTSSGISADALSGTTGEDGSTKMRSLLTGGESVVTGSFAQLRDAYSKNITLGHVVSGRGYQARNSEA